MIDTWATVGSCAQIGKNCHISGGAGIGGVLEPLQAGPVIIEDDCFIGARAEVAEGVVVEQGSVLSMGVYLGASTKIVDRATGELFCGRVPAYSVVVSGTLPGKPLPDGSPARPLLRGDRQAGRRADALQDLDQRPAARLMAAVDPVGLAQALVRAASVTPNSSGALDVLQAALEPLRLRLPAHRLRGRRQLPGRQPLRAPRPGLAAPDVRRPRRRRPARRPRAAGPSTRSAARSATASSGAAASPT